MPFFTEPEPPRGVPLDLLPGVRRIVARNPSVMTYHGTNTYLIEGEDGLSVLDPGPDDEVHVQEIIAAAGAAPIRRILLTHTHSDHSGAVAGLRAETGALVYGYKVSGKKKFSPDFGLDDGDEVAGLKSVFTPGHANDHLCFEYEIPGIGKILFSGDHVMSWSSSIVNPPDGDMRDYYRSLELLLHRDEVLYLSGHGPVLAEPRKLVAEFLAHRQWREATILKELQAQPWEIAVLSKKLYAKTDAWLIRAAERNVLAHLLKLQADGLVEELPSGEAGDEPVWAEEDEDGVNSEGGGFCAMLRFDASRRFSARALA